MPIYTRCPQCDKAYAAEDNMAGQEVLCRKCGAGFRLPSAGGDSNRPAELTSPSASTPQQDLSDTAAGASMDSAGANVQTFDSGMKERGFGSAKSRMDVSGPVDAYDVDRPSATRAMGESPAFNFPMAPDLDRWLPKLVIALMLLWTLSQAAGWTPQQATDLDTVLKQPTWGWFLLAGWLLILYLTVWLPIVYTSVRRAMAQMALRIPVRRIQRVATIAVLPFALGSVFWLSGQAISSLITGVILGCLPAGGAAFFLLRLRERQIVQALVPIVTGVAIAAAVSVGLTAGINTLLGMTLKTYHTADLFAGSPLGPCLIWPQRESPSATAPGARLTPGSSASTTRQAVPRRGDPTPLATASPLVKRIDPVGFSDDFDAAIFPRQQGGGGDMDHSVAPPIVRELVAIQRRGKTEETVELMSIGIGNATPRATARFASQAALGEVALSSDGRFLARLASFPRLSVHVWSFASGRVESWFDLSRDGGPFRIIGFNAKGEILVQSGRAIGGAGRVPGLSLEWLDPQTGTRRSAMELPGSYSAVVTYTRDLSCLAVINTSRETPQLEIYQIPTVGGSTDPVRVLLDAVDAALAARPSAVALSPDGARIALTFEQNRQVVLMLWDARTGVLQARYLLGGLDLPSSGQTSPQRSLVWLTDPGILIYAGNVVFDPNTGLCLGSLGLGEVVQAIPIIGERSIFVELLTTGGRHRLARLTFSPLLSPATLPATGAAAAGMFR